MVWRTIRVGFTLVLFGLFVMALGVQAQVCGDTISANTTLTAHIGPCDGDGLIIDTAGVVLNLDGHSISGDGDDVGNGVRVAGVTDVIIRNGNIEEFRTQINIEAGSDRARILDMDLSGSMGNGIQVGDFVNGGADNVVVKRTDIHDLRNSGLDVIESDNFRMDTSTIEDVGTGTQMIPGPCGTGNGIFIFGATGAKIINNIFRRISQSGILYWFMEDGQIRGNQVLFTSSRPCGPGNGSTDFGAITIVSASKRTVVRDNNIRDNDDFGIGLRRNIEDISILANQLRRNVGGIFFSRGATGTIVKNNCIAENVPDLGLQIDPTDSVTYAVNAKRNFWDATDGPRGDGPLGTVLSGTGEEVVQKATDDVKVVPFLTTCP